MTTVRRAQRRSVGLIALCGIFFLQAAAASPHNSVTFDEQYHLTLGYSYLKTGDLRFHRNQSPPLFELFIGLPLLLRSDLSLPTDHPAYALWGDIYLFSDEFLWHANPDAQGIAHSGRLIAAGFGALLGWLLFTWGRQLYGETAGWLAAFLWAFDPNFIANAIPTLDLGLAFFVTLAVWRLWRYLRRPGRLNLLLTGLALGAALATKFIGVMLLPAFALILSIYPGDAERRKATITSEPPPVLRLPSSPRAAAIRYSLFATRNSLFVIRNSLLAIRLPGRAPAFAVMLVVAWLVIWIVYRFQFGPIGGAGLPVAAPLYFESFIGMLLKSSEGRAIFLDGQVSLTGWPYYFVVALLLKTPLPVLIVTLGALLRWPWRREWRASSLLIVPAVLFFAAASISKLQLGYRYILPVLPFLFLIAARAVTFAWPRHVAILAAASGAWLIVGTLSIFPHYLSYFNELAGGPAAGYQHLVDSNLDWGQDLPALREWIDTYRPDNLRLGFFGTAYPERYGVQAKGIPGYPLNAYGHEVDGFTSYSLEPGQYAISATLLRIGLVFKQFDMYQAFQSMAPIGRAGYSILIYDVSYPPGADAVADRAVVAGPLAADVPPAALGARRDHPLRAKWCAWPECFVFTPHPARYIVRDFIPFAPDLNGLAHTRAKPIDVIRLGPDQAEYPVFELDATPLIENKLFELQSAPASTPDQVALTFPVPFSNGLSLTGYEARADRAAPGQSFDVLTYWRVDGPVTPPMTIFVHLLDAQGDIRGQHDGFGAALTTLEPGDVVIQSHSIPVDAHAAPGAYRLQVGLYNPVTLDRFSAHPPGLPPVDRILLSTLEVSTP